MAEFALENIVKLIILLVAAFVIIGLILTFQQDILGWWTDFTGSKTPKPAKAEVIERDIFTNEQIANFISGCWSENEGSTKDNECYFLLGKSSASFASVSRAGITNSLSQDIIPASKVVFEFTTIGNALIITYDNYHSSVRSEAIVVKG